MKKLACMPLVLVLALALLAACGKKTEAEGRDTQPAAPEGAVADSVFEADTDQQTQTTAPTESKPDPTKPTEGETTGSETKPTQPEATTPGSTEQVDVDAVDYAAFQAMTGAEQQAFAENFASTEDFFNWLNEKKAAYEKENPAIEIGADGKINMEDLLN